MKFKVDEVIPAVTKKYPYTHRVEVLGEAFAADKVRAWLDETGFHYVSTSWGVYYLGPKATSMLVLRWA